MYGFPQMPSGWGVPGESTAFARGQMPGVPQDQNGMQPGGTGQFGQAMWIQPLAPVMNRFGQQQLPPMSGLPGGLLGGMNAQPLLGGMPSLGPSRFGQMQRMMGNQPAFNYGIRRNHESA